MRCQVCVEVLPIDPLVSLDRFDIDAWSVPGELPVGSGGDRSLVDHRITASAVDTYFLTVGPWEDVMDVHSLVEESVHLDGLARDEVVTSCLHQPGHEPLVGCAQPALQSHQTSG